MVDAEFCAVLAERFAIGAHAFNSRQMGTECVLEELLRICFGVRCMGCSLADWWGMSREKWGEKCSRGDAEARRRKKRKERESREVISGEEGRTRCGGCW